MFLDWNGGGGGPSFPQCKHKFPYSWFCLDNEVDVGRYIRVKFNNFKEYNNFTYYIDQITVVMFTQDVRIA